MYHYYGYCPGWIYPDRVYIYQTNYVYVPVTPYRYYQGASYVDAQGADLAINELRQAWFSGDVNLFAQHLTDQLDIQVFFDGKYNYTTSTDDYFAMTADAFSTTQTVVDGLRSAIFSAAPKSSTTAATSSTTPTANSRSSTSPTASAN